MYNIDLNKLVDIFQYNPANPLLFSSSFFLFFLAIALSVYRQIRANDQMRIFFLVAISFYFYYKTSGLCFFLLLLIATTDFLAAHLIFNAKKKQAKQWILAGSLIIDLGVLAYFKYTDFFIGMIREAFQQPPSTLDIILPVGISFFIFQSISYVIDIYRGKITPLERIIDYVFYISFFPQLVAGPIVKAKDFIPQIHQPSTLTKETWGEAYTLILIGLFKKCIISDYISTNFVDRVFDAPALYSGVENLFAVYGYAVQIYCDFSGYSDMAIGLALLFGYRFNMNFNAPYCSVSITEFWRRWHISLSTWLKDYLYIPLGGNRSGKRRTYINLMITMLLGGLWHGASMRFVIWGGLHGVYLIIHKLLLKAIPSMPANRDEMSIPTRIINIVITFHLVCLAWVFFRAENMASAFDMFSQIFNHFNPSVFVPFIKEYGIITILIFIGIAIQFIPPKTQQSLKQWITDEPWIVKAVLVTLLILLITQTKYSEIQPFIYFQF